MIKKISILLLLAITISSCIEKKYEWSAFVSAPREYPVEVYTGAAGGYFFSQMGGFSNSGWGGLGGINNIKAPLPERLDMTWLSYVDNKFYTGDWKLPTEKITQLFDEGFYSKRRSKGEIAPYQSLNIGLGPKGMVVVWVSAGVHNQVEVARYHAHEIVIDHRLIAENEKYMFEKDYAKDMLSDDFVTPKDLKLQIEKYGYPAPEVFEEYRDKYIWRPKVILPEGSKITSFYIKMCNGEIENPYDRPLDQKKRAIPYVFEIYWSIDIGKKEQEFVSRIAFTQDQNYWIKYLNNNGKDEIPVDFPKNEIRKLFQEHIHNNKSAEIVIKINSNELKDDNWVTDFYIEQSGKKYNLNQICQDSGKL